MDNLTGLDTGQDRSPITDQWTCQHQYMINGQLHMTSFDIDRSKFWLSGQGHFAQSWCFKGSTWSWCRPTVSDWSRVTSPVTCQELPVQWLLNNQWPVIVIECSCHSGLEPCGHWSDLETYCGSMDRSKQVQSIVNFIWPLSPLTGEATGHMAH